MIQLTNMSIERCRQWIKPLIVGFGRPHLSIMFAAYLVIADSD
jgi:hypothetical protein